MKKVECPDCNGKGYHEYEAPPLFPMLLQDQQESLTTRVQCETCQGSGKIDDSTEDESASNLPTFRW